MALAFLVGSIAVQGWAWRRLTSRIRVGDLTTIQAVVRYCGWAFLPLLLFVALFFAAIGLEELFEVALIDERAALWVVPVLAIATLGPMIFAIRASFVRNLRPFSA